MKLKTIELENDPLPAQGPLCGIVCLVLIVVYFGTAQLCSAQEERMIGGVGITVFSDTNFRGKIEIARYPPLLHL